MKAIIFKEQGSAKDVLRIRNANLPAIGEGEVLIKVMARPVNPSDYMFILGQYRVKPDFPQIAGLEGSGIITKLHTTVSGFKKGDHVAFRGVGTWAEYISVKEKDLIAVNAEIPFEISCQIALNAVTAYALLELSKCKAGSYLLLSAGTSALAGLIIQIAATRNIKTICLVRKDSHSDELLKLGAFKVLKQDIAGLTDKIMTYTDNLGIDAFLDAVGGPILSNSIKTLRQGAIIILYGRYETVPAELYNGDVIYRNLTINGFGIAQWLAGKSAEEKNAAFAYIVKLIHNNQLILPQSHLFDMENINEALLADQTKNRGKIILIN